MNGDGIHQSKQSNKIFDLKEFNCIRRHISVYLNHTDYTFNATTEIQILNDEHDEHRSPNDR
jgi:hypothetical protein